MMNAGNQKGKTRQTNDWRRRMIAFVSALTLLISSCGLTAFAEPDEDIYSDPVTAPIPAANTSPEPEEGEAQATPAPEGQPETGTEPQEATGEGTETEGEPEVSEEPEDLTVYEPGTLTAEADGVGITVDYTAEARVPEGAVLTLTRAAGGDLYSALKSASKVLKPEEDATWKRELGEDAVFYAITLTDSEGNEVHPETGVTLTCTNLEIPADAAGFVTGENAENLDWKDTLTVEFLPDAIGYAYLKQVQIGTVTLTHEDRDYMVTAAYGPDAGFPADTELKVREIVPGTPEYALYSGMTDEALNEDWAEITLERYFDIAFVANGEELEPKADVDVQIVFRDKIEQNEETEVAAVHIENNEANVIEAETDSTKTAVHDEEAIDTVTFTSDSFSVYGVVQKKKIITKVLAADGNTYEIEITYTQEAEIPEESQVKVEEIPEGSDLWEAYRKQTAAALNADDVRMPGLFDISIVDGEGNKVEPKAPVNVALKLIREDSLTQDLRVVHFTEEIPQEQVAAESKTDEPSTDETSDQPVLQTEEQTETQAAEQTEVQPKVQPEEQTELQTTEQTEDQPKVQTEEHTEPQAAEQTEVQAPNKPEPLAEEDKIASETISASVEGDTVTFDTQSFSVYAFAYTVDFHYVVDGQRYDFSIPGGGFVSISEIMELLHIPTARGSARDVEEWPEEAHGEAEKVYFIPNVEISEETRNFVAQIENIQFSSPNLVSVSKVESTSTVGQIKERFGLACEYSAELTEKNIEDINSQTIQAGDWVLISVLPFTTEEWLTVTMKDGEVFTIKVTDAQIKKTVKTAGGDLYEIIVTYSDTAEIPGDAELVVREIMKDEAKYTSNVETANRELVALEKDAVENPVQFEISIVSPEGEEIEPREGSIVSVEIRLVPEIFAQQTDSAERGDAADDAEGEIADTEEPAQVFFYGSGMDIDVDLTEQQFSVVHMKDDEGIEVVENLVSTISEDNRIVLQFETESFSDYMVTDGSTTDLSGLPDQIYVGDVIYMFNSGRVWVQDLWRNIVKEVKHNDNDRYKAVIAKQPGTFNFVTPWDDNSNPSRLLKTITILPASLKPGLGAQPAPISTVNNASVGITLNLFDYDLDDYLDDRFNNYDFYNQYNTDVPISAFYNHGINAQSDFKFWGSGIGTQHGAINEYKEHGVTGIVKGTLTDDGYPQTNGGTSLAYLFNNQSINDKKAYMNVNHLFKKSGDYYVYDSNENYAYYPNSSGGGNFIVYNGTYQQKSRDAGGELATSTNGKAIGFFPFHEWNDQYDLFVNWNKNLNHHFGMSMSVDFTLPPDPKAVTDSNENPIVFEFSGDDDMWVYIDGRLAMDIGGIHQPTSGTINFTNHTVVVNGSTQMAENDFNIKFYDRNRQTGGVNLYDGQKHTLKVFYVERGGCDSNCKIKFNLTQYGDLKFYKHGEDDQPLQGARFGIYKDENCTTLLSEKLKDGTTRDFVGTSGGDDGSIEFSGLPIGNYYLKEIYAPEGYLLNPKVHTLSIKVIKDDNGVEKVVAELDGQIVDVNNPPIVINIPLTSITVKKEWPNAHPQNVTLKLIRYKKNTIGQTVTPDTGSIQIVQSLTGAATSSDTFSATYVVKKDGNQVATGSYTNTAGATVNGLEPGSYTVEVTGSDSTYSVVTALKTANVTVSAGTQTPVGVSHELAAPSSGDTAKVFLYVGYNTMNIRSEDPANRSSNVGYNLLVPKNSYVYLTYSDFDFGTYTDSPFSELLYWNTSGYHEWLSVSPGEKICNEGPANNIPVHIGDKDEYCIRIHQDGTNKDRATYKLTGSSTNAGTGLSGTNGSGESGTSGGNTGSGNSGTSGSNTETGTSGMPNDYIPDTTFTGNGSTSNIINLPDGSAWEKTLTNLPVCDEDGNVYYYHIEEENKPLGYNVTYTPNTPVIATQTGTIVLQADNTYIEPRRETVPDEIILNKKDENNNSLAGAVFTLYRDEQCTMPLQIGGQNITYGGASVSQIRISTDDEAFATLLPTNNGDSVTYYLKETTPPTGYFLTGNEIWPVTISVSVTGPTQQDYVIRATYTMTIDGETSIDVQNWPLTTVTVDKKWFQANGDDITEDIQHASITIKLTDGINDVTVDAYGTQILPVTLDGTETVPWQYTWTNLPKYDDNTTEINYTVVETSAKVGLNPDGTGGTELLSEAITVDSDENGKHLVNTLPKTSIKVEKAWPEGQTVPAGTEVDFTISATVPGEAGGEPEAPTGVTITPATVTLDGIVDTGDNTMETTAWEYLWENLPKYDTNGKQITYTVAESRYIIGTEYTASEYPDPTVTPEENVTVYAFENTLPTTEIEVTKAWQDVQDWPTDIASVTIGLYYKDSTGNSVPYPDESSQMTVTIGKNDAGHKKEFTDLPKYDNAGTLIEYSVMELSITLTDGTVSLQRDGSIIQIIGTDTQQSWSVDDGTVTNNAVTVTNTPVKTDFDILKVKEKTTQALTGAVFQLEKEQADGNYTVMQGYDNITVDENGHALVEGITDGNYRIRETKAPDGYITLSAPISFTVVKGQIGYTDDSDGLIIYTSAEERENATIGLFTIGNTPGVELPSTGGSGTLTYTLTGIFLITLAGVLLVSRKRKNER